MDIELDERDILGIGASAAVFAQGADRVIKLYRRRACPASDSGMAGVRYSDPLAMYAEELASFGRAQQHMDLMQHLVPFHGTLVVSKVIAAGGADASADYHLDCAVVLTRIAGTAQKVGDLIGDPLFPEVNAFLDALSNAGVARPWDASVFIPGIPPSLFTVIDIASTT